MKITPIMNTTKEIIYCKVEMATEIWYFYKVNSILNLIYGLN